VYTGLLLYLAVLSPRGAGGLPPRVLVHVAGEIAEGAADAALKSVLAAAGEGAHRVDLRRIDSDGSHFEATVALDLDDAKGVGALVERLQGVVPGGSVSVIEGGSLE